MGDYTSSRRARRSARYAEELAPYQCGELQCGGLPTTAREQSYTIIHSINQ